MRAFDQTPDLAHRAQLAEVLMSAAAALTTPAAGVAMLVPAGFPVRSGRLHLGRVRRWLPRDGSVSVVVGFAAVCWLGSTAERAPDLGRLTYRCEACLDDRGRVVLDRQVRAWLDVADPAAFEVVVMPVTSGGVVVVPVEDFGRRFEAVTS